MQTNSTQNSPPIQSNNLIYGKFTSFSKISMIISFRQSQRIGWLILQKLQLKIEQFNQQFLKNEGIIQNEFIEKRD
ncbi:unnamed protein product [Paramecium octaurelia]|uniref:Uncharacterized protein n=1 Tax=Paramecium octaurelia TaxID=43137 RepID=A0A8S1VWQ7_PAROT|nr:unnamed protein product [Paramecium octaurelia]